MKNYLLKATFLSALCVSMLSIACSESDNDDSSDSGDEKSEDGGKTVELTNTCSVCPELVITDISFTYPAGTVCKGEDGKAYYENGEPVDELGQSYEDHIANFGRYARFCTEVQN